MNEKGENNYTSMESALTIDMVQMMYEELGIALTFNSGRLSSIIVE